MPDNIRLRGKYYYYDIMIGGVRYKGTTKTADKKLAEHIADTIKVDILRKKHSLPSAINYQFKDLWDNYIQSQLSGIKNIERKIIAAKHFMFIFGNKSIQSINKTDIENYQLKRKLEIIALPKNRGKREQDIAFRSINIETGTLKHFFNFCINKGCLNKNPCTGIKKLNELSRLKTLSDGDIDKLIAGATNKLTRDLITFLIYTGCRKGEALNLKWDDVDLKNNFIAIKGTKNKYDRHTPISNPLKELLNNIEIKSEYLFTGKNGRVKDFKDSFKTACRNAGLKDMRIHDLRHVFASKMVMNGTSLYITGELLGHRTTQMTKRYSHLVPETLKKAVNDVFKGYSSSESPIKITKNTFVIADTHFGDSETESFLIDNWNSIVGKDDAVLHLGDFISEGESVVIQEKITRYAAMLNGRIFLIRGNHDTSPAEVYEKAGIKVINEYLGGHAAAASASLNGVKILFSHYPVKDIDAAMSDDDDIFGEATDYLSEIFDEKRYDINIHGHVHQKSDSFENLINVSPINTDYKPVKIKDVLKRFLENKNAVKP